MHVKICGTCRPVDAAAAAEAGADYVGVVLARGFRRSRNVPAAAEILAAADGVARAGVFVDPAVDEVVAAAESLGLDVVQLHGEETPATVAAIRESGPWRVWKALRPRDVDELLAGAAEWAGVADALLLDGWSARAVGGTGARLPWEALAGARDSLPRALWLVAAGGLNAENVGDAVSLLRPDVVDVSSGVERSIGTKDPDLLRAFVAAARGAGLETGLPDSGRTTPPSPHPIP